MALTQREKRSTSEARRQSGKILSWETRERLRGPKAREVVRAASYILANYMERIAKRSKESTEKKMLSKCDTNALRFYRIGGESAFRAVFQEQPLFIGGLNSLDFAKRVCSIKA